MTGETARPRAVRELLLVATLFLAYKLGRLAADGHVTEAFRNAAGVWRLERWLRLPDEAWVQGVLLAGGANLVRAADGYYAYVHFPATALFLIWTYVRRPAHYRRARWTLAAVTGAALVVHLLFPLAPPRMLGGALIDTGAVYGPAVYGSPATDTMANQYAAMPSLHFGWAMLVATGMIAATRTRWRWLWLLHPAATVLVIVGTANHYWIDAAVAGVLVAAVLLVPRPTAAPERHETTAGDGIAWAPRRRTVPHP